MSNVFHRINSVLRPEGKIFRGWWLVASSTGIQFMSGLFWMHSYGAYVVLLQEEFGWSNAVVAGAFALTRVESGLLGPIQGWLTDKYGPRLILIIGNVLFGVGFMLFAAVNSILSFYAAFVVIAVGGSLGGFATIMVSIVHWFDVHRSKAVAGSQMGFSLGGIAIPILIFALQLFGWRTTAFLSGVLIITITLPLATVMRHRPDYYGLSPDGGHKGKDTKTNDNSAVRSHFTSSEALRTSAFWMLALGHALALFAVGAVGVHLIPHLTGSYEYTLTQAGFIVTLMTLFQMTGQLIGGYLGDRFDKRLLCCACLLLHASAMVAIVIASDYWLVLTFALLHGLGWGIRAPLMVAIRAEYFGPRSFGTILGWSSLITMIGMSVAPILTGVLADIYGDYQIAFFVIAGCCGLGSLFFFMAKKPRSRHDPEEIRKRWENARRKLERKRAQGLR